MSCSYSRAMGCLPLESERQSRQNVALDFARATEDRDGATIEISGCGSGRVLGAHWPLGRILERMALIRRGVDPDRLQRQFRHLLALQASQQLLYRCRNTAHSRVCVRSTAETPPRPLQ